jgi:hypothetical protein
MAVACPGDPGQNALLKQIRVARDPASELLVVVRQARDAGADFTVRGVHGIAAQVSPRSASIDL